ncbi:MAG: PIN domain-containing protein [Roseiarcus sp.]
MTAFFDTKVLAYSVTSDPRKLRADRILSHGGVISAQVLNEFANVARNKLRKSWPEIEYAVERICRAVDAVVPLTRAINAAALALARDHGFSFYDALIVAAAIEAGCDTLYSEDMQDGRAIGGLTIRNPFLGSPP